MNYHILNKDGLDGFIKKLSKKMKVYAPVSKGHGNFAFEEVSSGGQVALKYIPTIKADLSANVNKSVNNHSFKNMSKR